MFLLTPVRTSVSLVLASFLVCSPAAPAAQTAALGLRVFGDVDFKGLSAGFVRDTPDLTPTGMVGAASSLQVAAGEVWEVCTEPRYGGRCRTVTEDIGDLRRGGWNDIIASVRRLRGGAARSFGPGPARPSATGLHLFGDINFRGSSATLTANTPDLEQQGMARMVSSVRVDVDEAWQVCTETEFRGRCLVVTEDQSDLRRGNWNDVIVSARRIRAPSRPSAIAGCPAASKCLPISTSGAEAPHSSANTPDVAFRGMPRVISSLRVAPGEVWEVCTEANYRGRCDVMFEDVSDLRRGEWNDVIASARRVR